MSASEQRQTLMLSKRGAFTLGGVTIRPSTRSIEGKSGSVFVEPRVMQVLLALYDAQGDVLSREDLLQQCWDGVLVGDDAINRTIAEIRRIIRETDAEFVVETIPRVGYRLSGSEIIRSASIPGTKLFPQGIDRRKLLIGGGSAIVLAAASGAAIAYRGSRNEVDALIERGRRVQEAGSPEANNKARALFRAAIAKDPGRAEAWGWLARVAPDRAQQREAAQYALTLDPKEANARVVLITQRRDLDDWANWEDALLEVLADTPDNTLALSYLTLFYQGMGRCVDSWDTNERLLAAAPFDPTGHHRKALKHWIFGRVGDADKVADRSLALWPRDPFVWNARMLIYAFTGRAPAALALLDDIATRPLNLKQPSIDSWRAALQAIRTGSQADIARAVEVCMAAATLAPGLAANAIMFFSHLGELDHAYQVAAGLFEGRGEVVQRLRGKGIDDLYSGAAWGRTQFLFTPATDAFRDDARFADLCDRLGHTAYWRSKGIWPDPFVRGSIKPG